MGSGERNPENYEAARAVGGGLSFPRHLSRHAQTLGLRLRATHTHTRVHTHTRAHGAGARELVSWPGMGQTMHSEQVHTAGVRPAERTDGQSEG